MGNRGDNNHKINPVKVPLETDQGIIDSEERKWGLPLREVYKHGLSFYKDKEGKALHLSYEDRLKLVAYTQQAAHGPLDVNSAPPLGVLDVIGRDRRAAWQALGQMSQIQAMAGFIHTLDRLCPLFKPYLEAIQKDLEDKKQQEYGLHRAEEERAHIELQNRIILEKQKQQGTKLTEEQQVQRIKDALNAQTYEQFLQYAQQQFPGNYDQQAILIRQLQDQHYQQYIQQLAVDQRLANSNLNYKESDNENDIDHDNDNDNDECKKDLDLNDNDGETDNKSMQTSEKTELIEYIEEPREEEEESDDGLPAVEEARMWTRNDITQFKDSARAGGGRLTVGHGETVTIRVPTHHHARCLCWEFATDNYDIGFGLFFEWSKSPTSEVTVHVSESDDEDDVDDDDDYTVVDNSDPELGSERRALGHRPLVNLVVPIYRRDCHTEVYAGSHTYPGEGVYLLKFDNTYSLWRSKSLYYKVYYTQ